MKSLIKLFIFIIYTISIFFINNIYILGILLLLQILIMLSLKLSIKKALYEQVLLLIVNITVFIFNTLISDIMLAILVSLRLVIITNATFIFKNIISRKDFIDSVDIIFSPLKIFKINTRDISLVIYIALTFISILSDELQQKKYSLKAKGIKINIKTLKYLLYPFIISIFKRTNEISISLNAKGYID